MRIRFYIGTVLVIYFAILFFLPFTDYFSEVNLKPPFIYTIADLLFSIFLFSVLSSSKIQFSLIDLLLLFFFLAACLCLAADTRPMLFSSRIFFLIHLLPFYIICRRIMGNKAVLNGILKCISFSFIIELIRAIVQYFKFRDNNEYGLQITGTFENSGLLSIYLVSVFPFIQAFLFEYFKSGWIRRSIFLLMSILLLLILAATRSRIAIITIVLFYFLLAMKALIRPGAINKKMVIYICVFSFLAFLSLSFFLLALKKDSSEGRALIWKITIDNFHVDKAITGTGYGSFPLQFPFWQGEYFQHHPVNDREIFLADFTKTTFNEYLQTFVELGFAGLIPLLILICWIFFKLPGCSFDRWCFSIAFSILSIFISAAFYYSFHFASLLLLLIILFAAFSAYFPDRRIINLSSVTSGICMGLLCMTFLLLFYSNIKNGIHIKEWIEANEKAYQLDDQASIIYDRQLPYFYNNGLFLSNYGEFLYAKGKYPLAIGILSRSILFYPEEKSFLYLAEAYSKTGRPAKAVELLERLNAIVPNRFSPKYHLFRIYRDVQDSVNATHYARMIMNLPVKVPSTQIDGIKQDVLAYLK